jgi:predicted naringenin-chalcone synthase
MSARLGPIGVATPPHRRTQEDLADVALGICRYTPEQTKLMQRFYERSSIRHRAGVIFEGNGRPSGFYPESTGEGDRGPSTRARLERYADGAGRLAVRAGASAMERAGIDPGRIDHVIVSSCTGFNAPGVDAELIAGLGLPAGAARTCIGFMGCHASLNALRVAGAHVRASAESAALVAAVELCSLHFFYGWDAEKVLANSLFADGAAACVVRAGGEGWTIADNASCVIPGTREAMTWRIGDHGFEMTLSREVPDLIRRHLRGWAGEWLGKHDLRIEDVRSWAIHPGGPKILDAVAESLGLTEEGARASREVLAAHGNMSSPTLLFIIDELRRGGGETPCVALGFGPGLAIEAALFS